MTTQHKVISRARAAEIAGQARGHGRRLVLANGCFDLLHVGHIRYLRGSGPAAIFSSWGSTPTTAFAR